jgi:hypothetical protein
VLNFRVVPYNFYILSHNFEVNLGSLSDTMLESNDLFYVDLAQFLQRVFLTDRNEMRGLSQPVNNYPDGILLSGCPW